MRFVYPEGRRKALTFSYDDGQKFDGRMVELFDSYGMKGTFHINSGRLGLKRGKDDYVEPERLAEVYAGHEVACHGVEHRNLTTIARLQALLEILEDRRKLEQLTGRIVQGLSYAYGNYNEEIKTVVESLGIKYARTIKETGMFHPPADFLEWHPTCHHANGLLELGDQFLDVPGFYELPLMYVWGHSFEFGWPDDWSLIETFVEKMAGKPDIWYATNMQICDYVQAVRSQEFSADGLMLHNPTCLSVWVKTDAGEVEEIKPGERKHL